MRVRFDHDLTTRELIESAKPHWGIAASLVAAAATTYGSQRAAASQRRATRNASALAGMPGGGGAPGNFQPTALQAQAKGGSMDMDKSGLKEILGQQRDMLNGQQSTFGEVPDPYGSKDGGFSADAKPPAPGSSTPAPGTKDPDSRMFQSADQAVAPKDNTNTYVNAATSLAGIAQGLAQRPQMQGAPIPQPGPMNFQPTALAQLARRNPYGGY